MFNDLFKVLFLGIVLLQPTVGWGQETDTASETAQPTWTSPELVSLPINWWTGFIVDDAEAFRSRADVLTTKISEYVAGLDADNLVTAQTSLKSLKTNLDAVLALHNASPPPPADALPTYDSYSLKQFFDLRKQRSDVEQQVDVLNLEQQQLARRSQLLTQRRDLNFGHYIRSDPNSPTRVLTGLTRINVRLELYVLKKQQDANIVRQTELKVHLDNIGQRIKYAANHLSTDELSLAGLDSTIQSNSDEVTNATRRLAAVQQKLLDATNADNPDTYNILNLKQQLTLASSEELLVQLRLELQRNIRDWYMLRSGVLDSTGSLHKSEPLFSAILKGAPQQAALWTDASQNTLITHAPESGRAARRDYEQAQANAHTTLVKIAEIQETMDNLALAQSRVASESLTLEQGLSGARLRVRLLLLDVLEKSRAFINVSLFRIGEHPVTIGSFVKALFVFMFFLALSWLIRKFLDRLERRKHFQQGSFYAGGRVLHYVILTIAIIAALGTIGLDFSSFALIAGALSVGIGFGLQSVVLNFVSGLILLFEGSIRVGDYVQLDSSDAGARLMGVVKEIRSRATMINTNDNVDVIVPNSELVGNRMVNWTLKESNARMRIPFSVAYGSDKNLVQKAALEAADEGEFCIRNTPGRHPAVRMMGFGDSALNFELRVWVNRQGVRRPVFVSSSILWAMDDKFKEYDIKVPFPQRDIHLSAESDLFNHQEPIETG